MATAICTSAYGILYAYGNLSEPCWLLIPRRSRVNLCRVRASVSRAVADCHCEVLSGDTVSTSTVSGHLQSPNGKSGCPWSSLCRGRWGMRGAGGAPVVPAPSGLTARPPDCPAQDTAGLRLSRGALPQTSPPDTGWLQLGERPPRRTPGGAPSAPGRQARSVIVCCPKLVFRSRFGAAVDVGRAWIMHTNRVGDSPSDFHVGRGQTWSHLWGCTCGWRSHCLQFGALSAYPPRGKVVLPGARWHVWQTSRQPLKWRPDSPMLLCHWRRRRRRCVGAAQGGRAR